MKNHMTVAEVAAMHGVHPKTVNYWINKGLIPATKIVRAIVVSRSDAESFERRPVGYPAGRPRKEK